MRKLLFVTIITVAIPLGLAAAFGVQASQPQANAEPHGNFSLRQARQFADFPVLYAGASVGSVPLVAVLRRNDIRSQSPFPANYVSFIYGKCQPSADLGCAPPVEIQTWPACTRHLALYEAPGTPTPEHTAVRGAPAAFFEDGRRLEIQTGVSTVVIFARTRAEVLRVASELRGANADIAEVRDLPRPAAGAVSGRLPCESS